MIYFLCAKEDFKPVETPEVVWLDQAKDYPLAKDYWKGWGHELPRETWDEAHERFGYQYAGIIQGKQIVSLAAAWKFSDKAWDVAAVSTQVEYQGQGYSKQMISFVTDYILGEGKYATCGAMDENLAMIATAKSVGFKVIPADQVWWEFPKYS